MKKYVPLAALLLIAGSALFYQWLRTHEQLASLDVRNQEIEKELTQLAAVRAQLPAFEERMVEVDKQIRNLQRRLPPEPGEDIFATELVDLFKEQNIKVNIVYSDRQEKDFYQETDLVLDYSGDKLGESDVSKIFNNIDRLARWELHEQNNVVTVRIYNSLLDMDVPALKPCVGYAKESSTYWPFSSMVKASLRQVEEKCLQRNQDEALFAQIKLLQYRKRFLEMLVQLVSHLDREIGAGVGATETTAPVVKIPANK